MKIQKVIILTPSDLIIGYRTNSYSLKYITIDMFDLSLEQRMHIQEAHRTIYKSGKLEIELKKAV